ncbi:hypothetical protein IMSAGC014_01535 [Bacteroidaceae bacterium]|nr:hypothetical protein IMSAGC014_01535 [Bacteroidaceae bacterium]
MSGADGTGRLGGVVIGSVVGHIGPWHVSVEECQRIVDFGLNSQLVQALGCTGQFQVGFAGGKVVSDSSRKLRLSADHYAD